MADDRTPDPERLAHLAHAAISLELNPFLQALAAAATEWTGSEAAAVLELDDLADSLRIVGVSPASPQALLQPPIPVEQSVAKTAIRTGGPLRIDQAASPIPADLKTDSNVCSLLVVPLPLGGKALGVLEVLNKDKTHYTEDDETILETLAALAALAMDRSSLKRRSEASLLELSELERLKNDFIAITSHELRTPLGVIIGHATYLHEVLGEEYAEHVEPIIKQAERLKDIVENLSNMDTYRTGGARLHNKMISMQRVVNEVAASFQEMAGKAQVRLEAQNAEQEILVEGDHTKISIALSNLVSNAISFSHVGGCVTIRSELMPGYVKVSVIDNGIGIPRKDLPRVFDRFFQVENHLTRHHNGMGLGLSVAKMMIEMHRGRIWAESTEGEGSTFFFLLPVSTPSAQPAMF